MREGFIFDEIAGRAAEQSIKAVASKVEVRTVSAPANSNLTAIANGVSCCTCQRSSVQDFKDNLNTDAGNIGMLVQNFVKMDTEQKMKNMQLFQTSGGLQGRTDQ